MLSEHDIEALEPVDLGSSPLSAMGIWISHLFSTIIVSLEIVAIISWVRHTDVLHTFLPFLLPAGRHYGRQLWQKNLGGDKGNPLPSVT